MLDRNRLDVLDRDWLDVLDRDWLDALDRYWLSRDWLSGCWQTVSFPMVLKDVLWRMELQVVSM